MVGARSCWGIVAKENKNRFAHCSIEQQTESFFVDGWCKCSLFDKRSNNTTALTKLLTFDKIVCCIYGDTQSSLLMIVKYVALWQKDVSYGCGLNRAIVADFQQVCCYQD